MAWKRFRVFAEEDTPLAATLGGNQAAPRAEARAQAGGGVALGQAPGVERPHGTAGPEGSWEAGEHGNG